MRTMGWTQFVKKPEFGVGCAVVIRATGQRGIVTHADWSMLIDVLLEGFDVATFRRDELALLGSNKWGD